MRTVVFVILLFNSSWSFAQNDQPLRFEKIEGLSQNTVYSIIKDKQGFLWVATADGLNRYDGVEMKIYKPGFNGEHEKMKGRIIRSDMLEDDKEQIWFSTDLVVNSFNKRKQAFTQSKLYIGKAGKSTDEGSPDIEVFAHPLLKRDSIIWFASSSAGLFAYNTVLGKCINYPVTINGEDGRPVLIMYHGVFEAPGKFWFASKKGLLCFDINSRKWTQHLKNKSTFTVSLCGDSLFIDNGKAIQYFNVKTCQLGEVIVNAGPSFIKKGLVRRIYTDKSSNVWAGDQEGNVYCKQNSEAVFNWKGNINGNTPSGTNYPVYCLYADTSGILWVGADVLGLLKADFRQVTFKKYPGSASEATSNKSLFVHSIYEDEEDKVWLGTFQNGLRVFDKRNGKTEKINLAYNGPPLLFGNSVPLIKKDSKGNLWTSSFGHLYIKGKNAQSFLRIKIPVPFNALQSPQLWGCSEYKDGWLLATNLGLYEVTKSEAQYHVSYLSQLDQSKLIDTWIKPGGDIWVINESRGIVILKNPGDRITERIFADINVKSLQYDSIHQFAWIATSNGLIAFHLPTGKQKIYGEDAGLLSSYIYGVLQEGNEIWVSTNYGLSRGIIEFKSDSVFPVISFSNFTTADGLPANEFNTGAFHKGKSGNLYFGTTNGVIWFRPEEVKLNEAAPRLQLINFLVNEERADSTTAPEYITAVDLPYYKNNLFFRFRGIDFNNGKKVKYMYQLQGWDKDWIHCGELNEVRYNKLAPGDYVFKIKAANGSGLWTKEEYRITVRITPPFWRTWWFYALCVFGLTLIIIMTTRYFSQQKLRKKIAELERQKELDKERQRISREMHDDIGAGLTQITLMSESAKTKNSTERLDDIAQTSRQLVNNMSEIIWSLNPENKTVELLMGYLREQINRQLEYSTINYIIQLPEAGRDVLLSNEQRRNILLVTKEIINNAIKYSGAQNLVIKATLDDHKLLFDVKDDGVGFDPGIKHTGNGLKNIQHRIEELNGTVVIESSPGKGSWFMYTVPLQRTT